MVENFLTNPDLSGARTETGATGLSVEQIQLVQEPNVCRQLREDYSNQDVEGYDLSFYSAGNRYFVILILDQPENTGEVISGLSAIDIYDENLNFIKGYSG